MKDTSTVKEDAINTMTVDTGNTVRNSLEKIDSMKDKKDNNDHSMAKTLMKQGFYDKKRYKTNIRTLNTKTKLG